MSKLQSSSAFHLIGVSLIALNISMITQSSYAEDGVDYSKERASVILNAVDKDIDRDKDNKNQYNRSIEEILVSGQYLADKLVSATKTNTPVLDVPQSLSVMTRGQIDDQALIDIGDVLRYTPGASIGQGEGHRDQITIRGQNTTADFYSDGLRDDVQYFRPLYNLERIEILRGSNALIFGRGGGGGIINRVTKTPTYAEDFTLASVAVDSFASFTGQFDTNFATGDSSAIRINGFYEHLDNHRDAFEGDRFAINPTFATEFSDQTRLLLSYEYVNDNRIVDRGVPALNGQPVRGFDTTFFGDPNVNITEFEAHITKARFEHDFSDASSFNTTIQYADFDKFYQNLFPTGFDATAGTVSLDGYGDGTDRQNLIIQSNFLRQFVTGFLTHEFLVGAEYGDQQTVNDRRDVLFEDSQDDVISFAFSDPLNIPAFSFPVLNRDRSSDVQFLSFYLQDQIDLGEHFKIIAGLRYDRFDINVVDRIEVANGSEDGNNGFLGRVDEEISPRLGLIYKPIENISVYTSFARSFLPRSGDQFLTLSLSTQALEPEAFENYEIGFKYDIKPGLSFTAALFRLDRENGTTVDPTDVGNVLLIGSRTEGLELQLVGEVTDFWSINAGYSFLNANERGRVVDNSLANRTLSQVPENMASIWNQFTLNERLSFGVGATYQGGQFASISNAVELPDFVRFDTALSYRIDDQFTVQFNVENLFDTDYFPAAHNDNNITTGEPLNVRLTLSGRF